MKPWLNSPTADLSRVLWHHVSRTSSTQAALKAIVSKKVSTLNLTDPVHVLSADMQTAGIGQRGNTWLTPKGALAMTCAFPWSRKWIDKLPFVALCGTVAVADALQAYGLFVQIKWANDILMREKKMGGVLVENLMHEGNSQSMILLMGIGLNVNNVAESMIITDQPVTSCVDETGKSFDLRCLRHDIFAAVWLRMHHLVEKGEAELLESVNSLLAFRGKNIIFEAEGTKTVGTLMGINAYGHLRVCCEGLEIIYRNGRIRLFSGNFSECSP
ncbi:MAG: biotin--[acetyl-CoA-carboxylase] ligase [Alphaproteobacteria bacterium]|nr:MAG: biotin--[acetyl-CoA-carboxylase] ligase [Alphaproteobacteria bacterium]